MRVMTAMMFLAGVLAVTLATDVEAQPPGQPGKGAQSGKGGFPGGGFGKGGFTAPQPGQIMPAFLQNVLKLTDDQKKELEALQKDVDAKLDKILTDDQKKQLKEMRERGPGGGFQPGGEGKGFPGKGGEKGPPPGDKGKGEKGNP